MSGTSFDSECPVCKYDMDCWSDSRPHDSVNGQCPNCGFEFYTKRDRISVEDCIELQNEKKQGMEGEELTDKEINNIKKQYAKYTEKVKKFVKYEQI